MTPKPPDWPPLRAACITLFRVNPDDLSLLLSNASGDADAVARLLPLVYDQLRRDAQAQMAVERAGHTLSATALVHEAFLKLAGPREIPWQNRAHFYAAAAEAMRRVLLDHARSKGRLKRGGGARHVDLDAGATLSAPAGAAGRSESADCDETDVLALESAIQRLEGTDPRMAQVVRLRFYAGLEVAQAALVLGVSERTVKHDWAFAKAWLARELQRPDGDSA